MEKQEKKGLKFPGILHKREAGEPRKKKEKNQTGTLRKNTLLRICRVVLWGMLAFVFLKGVVSTFRADTLTEAKLLINDFKAELNVNKKLNNEILAFAQNFVKEYLTYEANGESDYKERLKAYMANAGSVEGMDLRNGAADAVYVQAYRLEQCSDTQWDVYVLAEVEYTQNVMDSSAQEYRTETEKAQTYLKVPVYVDGEFMTVESLPLFISDSMLLEDYPGAEYYGTAADEKTASDVETAVTNFLKAYYEQDETVIDYYLSKDARQEQFSGLNGRYQFVKMNTVKCYREQNQNVVVCIANFYVKDSINSAQIQQKLLLQLVQESDGKYYILSITPRVTNING